MKHLEGIDEGSSIALMCNFNILSYMTVLNLLVDPETLYIIIFHWIIVSCFEEKLPQLCFDIGFQRTSELFFLTLKNWKQPIFLC